MDLDCQEALKTIIKHRRDVHTRFTGDLLGEEELANLLNAAHAVPSVGNSQPWDFVVVRDPATLDAFTEHVTQCRQDYADSLDGEQWEKFNPVRIRDICESGMGIVATYDPIRFGLNVLGRHIVSSAGMFSVVCAVQNLWLMVTALDFGVERVSFCQESFFRGLLGLPEQARPVGWLCVDHVTKPQEVPDLIRFGWNHRIALEEAVHHGYWRLPPQLAKPGYEESTMCRSCSLIEQQT